MGGTTNQEKNQSQNKAFIIIIVLLIVLIITLIIGMCLILNRKPESAGTVDTKMPETTGNLVVDESNLTSIGDDMQSKVEDGMFEVNMNTVWNFPNGQSASTDAYVANAGSNHYPISFEIIINESEVIYSSTVIPVGSRIKEIKMEKELSAGAYDAVCMYHLWKEDGTENSKVGVNIVLNVLE